MVQRIESYCDVSPTMKATLLASYIDVARCPVPDLLPRLRVLPSSLQHSVEHLLMLQQLQRQSPSVLRYSIASKHMEILNFGGKKYRCGVGAAWSTRTSGAYFSPCATVVPSPALTFDGTGSPLPPLTLEKEGCFRRILAELLALPPPLIFIGFVYKVDVLARVCTCENGP
jgi:hypothetical protein